MLESTKNGLAAMRKIMEAASALHVVQLDYEKPGEQPTTRYVEPYDFQESRSSVMIRCYQLHPEPLGDTSWRNFRVDRITRAVDTGQSFEPRRPVTLPTGEVEEFVFGQTPTAEQTPTQRYMTFIESAMMDGKITSDEMSKAKSLGRDLSGDKLRAVHARVLRDVIDEMLVDGALDRPEAVYLDNVQKFLHRLGWAPGISRNA